MKAALQRKFLIRLRAAIALAMLVVGWASAPVALAFEPSDACAMACCISDGHCCCNPRKPSVEGQLPDGNDHIDTVDASSDCPQGCTTPQYSSKLRQNYADRAAINITDFSPAVAFNPDQEIKKQEPVGSQPSSPRGPPTLSAF